MATVANILLGRVLATQVTILPRAAAREEGGSERRPDAAPAVRTPSCGWEPLAGLPAVLSCTWYILCRDSPTCLLVASTPFCWGHTTAQTGRAASTTGRSRNRAKDSRRFRAHHVWRMETARWASCCNALHSCACCCAMTTKPLLMGLLHDVAGVTAPY